MKNSLNDGHDLSRLNPEPTDVQRAIWRKHHKAGTTPGNPKWYRASTLPKTRVFKPGAAPVYPAWCKGVPKTKPITCFPKPNQLPAEPTTREYVDVFEEDNHYRSTTE